jgi:Ca2+-binding EF-hand superfamily protein
MIDVNNDGMVTAMELNHAKQAMEFARLDKNNDGVLSPAEVNSRSKMIMELLNRNN